MLEYIQLPVLKNNPDLSPSDYYFFSKLKSNFCEKRFNDEDSMVKSIMKYFKEKPSCYFSEAY